MTTNSGGKKQTAIWTMKDGTKIRICDMGDSHLINTIRMLERATIHKTNQAISSGYSMLGMLQGEAAIDSVESDLNWLEDEGLDPADEYPIYSKLVNEAIRRKLDVFPDKARTHKKEDG